MRSILIAAGLVLLSSAATAATENFTVNVGTDERNGACFIHLPREDGMELVLSVRARDTNVNVQVDNIPPEWIDESREFKISIKPDMGKEVKTDSGTYVAGFTYRAQGWWDEAGGGKELLVALKGGKSFTVSFDGHKPGVFPIQQSTGSIKDYAYTWLKQCMDRNGGDL